MLLIAKRLARSTSRANSDAAARRRSDTAAQRRCMSWFSFERVLWNTRSNELSTYAYRIYYNNSQMWYCKFRLPINESRCHLLRSRSVLCPPHSAIEIWMRFRWRKGFVSGANNFTHQNWNWRNAGMTTCSTFLNDILYSFSQMY